MNPPSPRFIVERGARTKFISPARRSMAALYAVLGAASLSWERQQGRGRCPRASSPLSMRGRPQPRPAGSDRRRRSPARSRRSAAFAAIRASAWLMGPPSDLMLSEPGRAPARPSAASRLRGVDQPLRQPWAIRPWRRRWAANGCEGVNVACPSGSDLGRADQIAPRHGSR